MIEVGSSEYVMLKGLRQISPDLDFSNLTLTAIRCLYLDAIHLKEINQSLVEKYKELFPIGGEYK